MATLSTHVLDTSLGRPAVGVAGHLGVRRGRRPSARGRPTRTAGCPASGPSCGAGDYRLRFDTAAYYAQTGVTGFYPEVVVAFTVAADEHYHVPLLLTPHGYSTYRGS